jgi:glutamate synthase (NADPH/NADH) large chain
MGLVDVLADMSGNDAARLRMLIAKHARFTDSARARTILTNWNAYLPKFKKVMPVEYRRALSELKAQEEAVPMRLAGE